MIMKTRTACSCVLIAAVACARFMDDYLQLECEIMILLYDKG